MTIVNKRGVKLEKSHIYRIVYILQAGNYQWYKYEATMTYLDYTAPKTIWNLRPLAGTQSLPLDSILEAHDLGPSQGRESPLHKLKTSLGRYTPTNGE